MNQQDKLLLRKRMQAALACVSVEQWSAYGVGASGQLAGFSLIARAKCIFCFVSMPGELDTRGLITRWLADGRMVCVPRIIGRGLMEAVTINNLHECCPGPSGIPQPPAGRVVQPDLCITPGLAFTIDGLRLGRGGGYYDRFLAAHPMCVAVGLSLDQQVISDLPADPDDRPVSWIVTPTRTIRCKHEKQRNDK